MAMNVTRGGLRPAKLINLKTNEIVNFMFNPHEFTISKSNNWSDGKEQGVNMPKSVFQRGQARTLSLVLHFDTQADQSDVTQKTAPLWKMMDIVPMTKMIRTGKGLPPPVAFYWGSVYFRAIITQMQEKFTLFSDQGIPLRCEVTVSLKEYVPDAQATTATTAQRSTPPPEVLTMLEGDRPDHIASRSGGKPSDYRKTMALNNIDNPLKIRKGKQLKRIGR